MTTFRGVVYTVRLTCGCQGLTRAGTEMEIHLNEAEAHKHVFGCKICGGAHEVVRSRLWQPPPYDWGEDVGLETHGLTVVGVQELIDAEVSRVF